MSGLLGLVVLGLFVWWAVSLLSRLFGPRVVRIEDDARTKRLFEVLDQMATALDDVRERLDRLERRSPPPGDGEREAEKSLVKQVERKLRAVK